METYDLPEANLNMFNDESDPMVSVLDIRDQIKIPGNYVSPNTEDYSC